MTRRVNPRVLRGIAFVAVLAGAVASEGFMLRAGRHQPSHILMIIFTLWVLAPFALLILAHVFSKHWSVRTQLMLYSVMLIVALGSSSLYGYVALGPTSPKTAAVHFDNLFI